MASSKPRKRLVLKQSDPIPDLEEPNEFGVRLCKPYTLKEHQITALKWMRERELNPVMNITGGILALHMGLGKCLAPNTPILLWNGTVKYAKEIVTGDILIGDDNKPRNVLGTCKGRDKMYRINQDKGESYEVNSSHILSLKYADKCIDINIKDYFLLDDNIKNKLRGYKSSVEWPEKEVSIDAFLMGKKLKESNIDHIPIEYITNSRRIRIRLLEGMGAKCINGKLEIVHCNNSLINDTIYLVRSLGYSAKLETIQKSSDDSGLKLIYKCVCFYCPELSKIKIDSLEEGDYYGFQVDENGRFLLGDWTVTHNSLCVLTHIMSKHSSSNQPLYPSLIVCPLSAIYTWIEQIEKFFSTSLPYLIIREDIIGNELHSMSIESFCKYKIIITNYETLRNVSKKYKISDHLLEKDSHGRNMSIQHRSPPSLEEMNQLGPVNLFNIPYEVAVMDESHNFANPKTQLFYSVMSIYAKSKWCLTGTPLRNKALDIYSQLRFLGLKEITNPNTGKKIARSFNINLFHAYGLEKCILNMTLEEANVNLPPKCTETVLLTLSDQERELHDQLWRTTQDAFNHYRLGCDNYMNVLTNFLRCRQTCLASYSIVAENPHIKLNNLSQRMLDWLLDKTGTSGLKSAKINATMEIIKRIPREEKIIVFTTFKQVIYLLEERMRKDHPDMSFVTITGDITGIKRVELLDKFKKERVKVMFLSYKAGSESLNLTEAAYVILMEPVWTPAVLLQAASRVHRVGQEHDKVIIYQLICKNTVENNILKICTAKSALANDFSGKKLDTGIDSETLSKILDL